MPQRAPRLLASTYHVVAPLGFLLLALTYTEAHAQTRGGLGSSLDLLYLVVVEPLLPLLAGSGYVRLIAAEARRLGTERTAIVHAVGIALAATAFVLLLVTNGSDKVGIGLYLVLLAWSLGAAAATGSLGGVVATMALALVAMVHGIWG